MKISRLSILTFLCFGHAISLSSTAKTLVFDDFLKYQDTTNTHFDFAKPIPNVSAYESQFMIDNDFFKNCKIEYVVEGGYRYKSIYEYVKLCKGIGELNAFQAKKHKDEFEEIYTKEYHDNYNKVKQAFTEVDEIELNRIVHRFHLKGQRQLAYKQVDTGYDMDTGVYTLYLKPDMDNMWDSAWYKDHSERPLGVSRELKFMGTPLSKLSQYVTFELPMDIAERIYTNDGALIANIKMSVKVNPECLEMNNSQPYEKTGCFDESIETKIKDIYIEVVEKNELYSQAAFDSKYDNSLWKKIPSLMKNKDDAQAVLNVLNDKRVIYSTNKVNWKND